ncbi:hypothetical protein [Streptomyces lucensis]|uniref:hypothetical protein n=1 Tax=Streptomyces lucensis TaxID=67319 RepID=UPI000A847FB9|nr:hypothetical protein [Streptomyces lucensis]
MSSQEARSTGTLEQGPNLGLTLATLNSVSGLGLQPHNVTVDILVTLSLLGRSHPAIGFNGAKVGDELRSLFERSLSLLLVGLNSGHFSFFGSGPGSGHAKTAGHPNG